MEAVFASPRNSCLLEVPKQKVYEIGRIHFVFLNFLLLQCVLHILQLRDNLMRTRNYSPFSYFCSSENGKGALAPFPAGLEVVMPFSRLYHRIRRSNYCSGVAGDANKCIWFYPGPKRLAGTPSRDAVPPKDHHSPLSPRHSPASSSTLCYLRSMQHIGIQGPHQFHHYSHIDSSGNNLPLFRSTVPPHWLWQRRRYTILANCHWDIYRQSYRYNLLQGMTNRPRSAKDDEIL